MSDRDSITPQARDDDELSVEELEEVAGGETVVNESQCTVNNCRAESGTIPSKS